MSKNKNIRQYPANMFLCQYHLIVSYMMGNIKADPQLCRTILDESLAEYILKELYKSKDDHIRVRALCLGFRSSSP